LDDLGIARGASGAQLTHIVSIKNVGGGSLTRRYQFMTVGAGLVRQGEHTIGHI
jgi:hypothetical protein